MLELEVGLDASNEVPCCTMAPTTARWLQLNGAQASAFAHAAVRMPKGDRTLK
jgi:hypothetical protein